MFDFDLFLVVSCFTGLVDLEYCLDSWSTAVGCVVVVCWLLVLRLIWVAIAVYRDRLFLG